MLQVWQAPPNNHKREDKERPTRAPVAPVRLTNLPTEEEEAVVVVVTIAITEDEVTVPNMSLYTYR